MPGKWKAGDKVIVLAGAASTAAVAAGAVSAAIAAWIARHSAAVSLAALFAGGVLGWIVGIVVGRILFPATDGSVRVARWGKSSLRFTLKGNILASFVAAVVVAGLAVLVTGVDFVAVAAPCVATSVVLGAVLAVLTSLV